MSYLSVFNVELPVYNEQICPGDVVAVGQSQHPQFEVLAVRNDKAWVRNTVSGQDSIVVTSRCRRL